MTELADTDDSVLVAAIGGWARAEAAAAARRLAAVAELVCRRREAAVGDSAFWSCDDWDAIAAEVAASQHISHGMASTQMYLALALRERLPRVAALFAEGAIGARLASTIAWRTNLIKDDGAMQRVDAALADIATTLGPLSVAKTAAAIDALIDRYDPGALRRTRDGARGREVVIDSSNAEDGTTALWGRLFSVDATALDRRLTQLAHSVCDDDPRTLAQRRADALGALAAGAQTLACSCGNTECAASVGTDARANSVVIHIMAEAAALEADPDIHMSGEDAAPRPINPDLSLTEVLAPEPEPDPPAVRLPAAQIVGGGTVPAALVAELARAGATVTPLRFPPPASDPGYRPSAALAAFIRCRDMTCRFPGCDRPAERCDIDHAIAYPVGPTHPSNLRLLCRKHHLLKTFWTGPTGWRDTQHPDGTIEWASPSGHTYTTRPGSRLLFPDLCLDTGDIPRPAAQQRPRARRDIMMPTRKRTREEDRARRISAERALNAAHVAERNRPPPF